MVAKFVWPPSPPPPQEKNSLLMKHYKVSCVTGLTRPSIVKCYSDCSIAESRVAWCFSVLYLKVEIIKGKSVLLPILLSELHIAVLNLAVRARDEGIIDAAYYFLLTTYIYSINMWVHFTPMRRSVHVI